MKEPRLKNTLERFSANRGETLVETLCAILVSSFAIVMLTTAVVASATANKAADDRDAVLQVEQQAAESHSDAVGTGTVTLGGASYSVTYYGGDDMVSYRK